MSENLRKLIGVAVLVGIVVVGIVATNDDDSDFTRNLAIPGASPLLEDQEDLRFELLERRIADVEKLLAKEQLAELANVARTLTDDIRLLEGRAQDLVEDLIQLGVDARRTSEGLLSDLRAAADATSRTSEGLLSDLRAAADATMGQIEGGGQIDGGWIDVLDLMCQQQLSSWGRTATRVTAVYDVGDPGIVSGFWACRYDNLNLPEYDSNLLDLEPFQRSEQVGVCLPGSEPRAPQGFPIRRWGDWETMFAESINRWVFPFNSGNDGGVSFGTFCH